MVLLGKYFHFLLLSIQAGLRKSTFHGGEAKVHFMFDQHFCMECGVFLEKVQQEHGRRPRCRRAELPKVIF